MTPAVSVRGLRKQYPGHLVVAGLDLDIARGEVFSLLGPNGAGKTTTVEILEGHRQRTDGEVTVLGEDPGKAGRAWRSRIGIVLQTANDAAEVIEKVGLAEKAKARVKTLSGGQRRRVDVALGIIGRPELLFLDEPTTGFDPEARRHFWTLISELAAEGTSILLTTHYLDEAEALADRVAVIARGEIVAQDTPQNLGGRAAAEATVRWTDERGAHVERTAYPTKLVTELSAGGRERAGRAGAGPGREGGYLDLIGD